MVLGAQNIALVYIPVETLNFDNATFHPLFSSLLYWSKCKIFFQLVNMFTWQSTKRCQLWSTRWKPDNYKSKPLYTQSTRPFSGEL